jgi:hypothetical protein
VCRKFYRLPSFKLLFQMKKPQNGKTELNVSENFTIISYARRAESPWVFRHRCRKILQLRSWLRPAVFQSIGNLNF